MEESLSMRFKNAWNAFRGRDPTEDFKRDYGVSYSYRPDGPRFTRGNERSIISAIYTRISMDCAAIDFEHAYVDYNGNYVDSVDSKLNRCLTLDANVDQTGVALVQDIVMSMLDEGTVAIVPTDTTKDPMLTDGYDVLSIRTGKIVEWRPKFVKVNVYNENLGKRQDILLPKKQVAIVQNPLYAIMNEPNSTLQRLIRTLNNLDRVNRSNASNKLDLIIQLPYTVKNETRKKYAEERRKDLETQLATSTYGVAYADSTEKIIQLNRAVENNLWNQATELQAQLYNQLGISQAIFDGTADDKQMVNYYNRTIYPIMTAISLEMTRKFISKTAQTQGQRIKFFRDPFSLMPVDQIAEIADKFTRNEIMTANELRSKIGLKPSDDPGADELRNKNLNPTGLDARMMPEDYGQEPVDESEDAALDENQIE